MTVGEFALQDPRAPFIRRWAAGAVDLVLAAVAILTINRLIPESAHAAYPMLGSAIAAAVAFAYYWLPEALWGRTPGKLASGIRVVDDEGRAPGAARALARTLLRLVEVNPFLAGGLPAAIVAYKSKAGQRMGDLLAGTYVLKASDLARLREGSADAVPG